MLTVNTKTSGTPMARSPNHEIFYDIFVMNTEGKTVARYTV